MLNQENQIFIGKLIHSINRFPAGQFKQQVMDHLMKLIPFDMALWAGGYTQELQLNNVFLYNLPNSLMDSWEQIKHQDKLLAGLIANPGKTLDVFDFYSRHERENLAIYQQHSKLFGIENAISTAIPNPKTGLLEIMSLYRQNPEQTFTDKEQLAKQFVFPLMINALHANQIQHMVNLAKVNSTSALVLCDNKAWIRFSEPECIQLLKQQWPQWSGPVLPKSVAAWLHTKASLPLKRRKLVFIRKQIDDMILLQVYPANDVTDLLSKREDQIARIFASGLTYKEIATDLELSPATVRRHIESVYKKLMVSNKIELHQALHSD
ncbi:CheY-like receiver domain and HTH DNA-binding domain-containing response regulator [Desulfocapsa sulfexigens DSM 10523]|uniref:CheY-like receiver domain and HTH DNA-binding domain-containing response regulator n=1 Tax=Desulfocapsa sulfexigens (strain DSM 10523 / SB164P1) TaxID=1167006 RepID=M1PNL5_DESSD|nr:helix-turn-helix transcriptional regulator [Desulfocapsa sulfexigens]AGF77996.1 CheY-like receiver domain and HTH DNA-binding domain-containing response regulator [Desulfocapsa sulfexigens DSM 10523]